LGAVVLEHADVAKRVAVDDGEVGQGAGNDRVDLAPEPDESKNCLAAAGYGFR
jgi:hypothetical protein